MSTPAERTSAKFAKARAKFESKLMPDDYRIIDSKKVRDSRGGTKEQKMAVESGKCHLLGENRQGIEQGGGQGPFITSVAYSALLPYDTTIKPDDEIKINGRVFQVTSVRKAGEWGLMVQVELEERE